MISFHSNISYRAGPDGSSTEKIEGIEPCLGPSAVELTFPLNSAKGSKLSFAAMAGDQIIFQDGIQLPSSPLSVALGGYAELLSKVRRSTRRVLKIASGESGGICETDTRATPVLAPATHHQRTRHLVGLE
jgi:hypothetical protein